MDYASSIHFRLACCQHLSSIWFSEPRSNFGHAILRPSLLRGYSLGWLHVGPSVLQYCPRDASHLVRQRHDREHRWLSVEDACQPCAWLDLPTPYPGDDGTRAHYQQTSERPFAHFRYPSKPLLSSGGSLKRGQANPCRKVTSLAEGHGADPRHRSQPARIKVVTRPLLDFLVELC